VQLDECFDVTGDSIQAKCAVCGSCSWVTLTNSSPQSCATTGLILNSQLLKFHCSICGLLAAGTVPDNLTTDYYSTQYSYYERVGVASSDRSRYAQIVEWLRATSGGRSFPRIIDIGCGRGEAMAALKALYQPDRIRGVDPSIQAGEQGRADGHEISTATLDDYSDNRSDYDLVFSNNVIQHVDDPGHFMQGLAQLVGHSGLVAIYCPDGGLPGEDLLWADHRYSLSPANLASLGQTAGLYVEAWSPGGDQRNLEGKQLILLSKEKDSGGAEIPKDSPGELYGGRHEYFALWPRIEARLSEACTAHEGSIFNFGASTWSYLLRAYCPRYWQQAEACVVDDGGGRFGDQVVISLPDIQSTPRQTLFGMGVNPAAQEGLRVKLEHEGYNVVSWDDVHGETYTGERGTRASGDGR
jgi:SAM-dependent methyltransferase